MFVPVSSDGAVRAGWSRNVSTTGLAMVAVEQGEPLRVGAELALEFGLPGRTQRIHARARLEWRTPLGSERTVALGLSFSGLPAGDQAVLRSFVAEYLPQLPVLRASPAEVALCEEHLGGAHQLHFARDLQELASVTARSDFWAFLVFGDAGGLEPLLEGISRLRPPDGALQDLALVAAHRPQILFFGQAPEALLLTCHNLGRLDGSVVGPVQPQLLVKRVEQACDQYSLRFEQGRASLELGRLREDAALREPRRGVSSRLEELVAQSQAMQGVLELLRAVARHRVPVLLQGETGTGKELLSAVLHELSDRAGGPFVALDCGTLSETLLESELFGHVKGAFTGADADHLGLFRLAEGGTILLDEIQNMTPRLQAKLLRVLETSEVRPVGGTRVHRADIRLIAASNRDLKAEVEAGRLRADLYYRLDRFPVLLPPLRDRKEDVLPLARSFLRRIASENGRPVPELEPRLEAALQAYSWPGNVREVRNVIERAWLLSRPGAPLEFRLLPPALRSDLEEPEVNGPHRLQRGSLRERLDNFERELIAEALGRHQGAVGRAAMELGTHRVTFARRARALGLLPQETGSD